VITGLAHTAVCVPDVEAAVQWYADVLGLQVLSPPYLMEGDAIAADMGELIPEPRLKAAIVGFPDDGDRVLEVLEYPGVVAGDQRQSASLTDTGLTHVALLCSDIEETRAALEAKGVRFLVRGVADVARVRTTWFVDPWGVVFILVEKSRPDRPYYAQWDDRRMRGRKPTVAVLGAGFGGIAMGIKLREAGYPFTVYEKSDGVGGTWRDNTYPGAACDVPSHLYSFSFELNPWWSRTYATQPEILAYLERCTDQYGVRPHLRLNTTVNEARWDDEHRQWQLTTDMGETFTADVLVSGLGMLNVPVVPEIPGADRFRGRLFHSSRWDHSKPVAGERVASIGTGASAIQYVPAIASEVEHLTVFQRSPIWITPRIDRAYDPDEQRRFARVPLAARIHRWQIWWTYERSNFRADSEQTAMQTALARSYLERKIADPALRAKLTPDFPVGCKRPLMSREWLPALTQPNVRVVNEPITELTAAGVRTADGEEHAVDTIVFGTGFRANEYLCGIDVYGRDGRRLRDDWRDGAEAHLGVTVSGYPNLFLLYGPNTNGVNSIIFMHEAQVHYVMRALALLARWRVRSVEVRRSVMARYNRRIQAAMKDTVWLAGCSNYYRTPGGKVVTQLPYSGGRYWLRTRFLPFWHYRMQR
jgi:cation diffusion facilitator CzcD-associated flavoprotein CzcO/predicted enzyme related to lactoylglutathione lyase